MRACAAVDQPHGDRTTISGMVLSNPREMQVALDGEVWRPNAASRPQRRTPRLRSSINLTLTFHATATRLEEARRSQCI